MFYCYIRYRSGSGLHGGAAATRRASVQGNTAESLWQQQLGRPLTFALSAAAQQEDARRLSSRRRLQPSSLDQPQARLPLCGVHALQLVDSDVQCLCFSSTCSFYTSKSQNSCGSFTPRIKLAGRKVGSHPDLRTFLPLCQMALMFQYGFFFQHCSSLTLKS